MDWDWYYIEGYFISELIHYYSYRLIYDSLTLSTFDRNTLLSRFWRACIPDLLDTVNYLLSPKEHSQFILSFFQRSAQTEEYLLETALSKGFKYQELDADLFLDKEQQLLQQQQPSDNANNNNNNSTSEPEQQQQQYEKIRLIIFTRKREDIVSH